MALDPTTCPKCGGADITKNREETGPIAAKNSWTEGVHDAGTIRHQWWACSCGHEWYVNDAT